jgi:energy-coupling factor transporter ATP-binding protein EcfA2
MFSEQFDAKLLGVHTQYQHETLTVAHLLGNQHFPVVIAPLQSEEVDIGETLPARCLRQGLWLARYDALPFALLQSPAFRFGQAEGTHIEIAVPAGETGSQLSRRLLDELESLVRRTASYRGKVISLESPDRYSGHHGALRVHRLRCVRREEVVLPEKTLELLERNIGDFIRQREQLKRLGLPIKKGVLFYGPPGTGKTHTIHYLAGQLPDHTTLLITAEQVGLLDHYFQLARFLQPAMIVIEDVDLIARARETMYGPCDESLLNKLLNEMDGLREDAAVMFVLTTNRPENLEAALASRPGRIDQAIEFPLPDERGRRLLVRLYSCGLPLDEEVVETIVSKTDKASAAFIKELMRRAAQYHIHSGRAGQLQLSDLNAALEEMLFAGGSLNAKLLGAANVAPN